MPIQVGWRNCNKLITNCFSTVDFLLESTLDAETVIYDMPRFLKFLPIDKEAQTAFVNQWKIKVIFNISIMPPRPLKKVIGTA